VDYAVEMLHITKTFGTLVANDDVTIQVKKGEIHALLGENGAGKSTLMSILFGLYQAEAGSIKVNGNEVRISNPNVATDLKIGMVHQHFKLVDVFSVTENIILGMEPNQHGIIYRTLCEREIAQLSQQYHMEVNPRALIRNLSVGMQQRVEILKMLYRKSDILIFDEPTAVLTPQEILELIKTIKAFAAAGKTVIVISHKLNEIKAMADRCTILRKGKVVATVDVPSTSIESLAEMMVGRKVLFEAHKKESIPGEILLEAEHLSILDPQTKHPVVSDVSFEVRRGEIVCIAGVDGNGQSELIKGITGLLPLHHGFIRLLNHEIGKVSIRHRLETGMGHIPEDRQRHGLVLDYTMAENMILNRYHQPEFQHHGVIQKKAMLAHTEMLIERFDIRSSEGPRTMARSMSGGNQQKAILAREVSRNPEILVAVQPTRGLDVGAIEFVHQELLRHRDSQKGVLLVSFELEEVLNISDRILVMYNGQIVASLTTSETNSEELGLYMLGAKTNGGSNHETH
jgi:simple sugar transport system ATP-binding protein